MDRRRVRDFVKETFENPFEEARFRDFVRNLLNHIEEEDSHPYSGQFIATAFQPYISTLKRIGKYSDGEHEIDILIVQLKKETSLERARTAQRNFIARYLNGSRGGKMKDAALVAFVSPNETDWRFSLIKMDYKFVEGKNGKTKVKEEFTPARRWSFLVGPNEHSHTAQVKLAPIIEDETIITLARLEEAFNIEKVTKEFFEKYRNLFADVKEALDKILVSNDSVRNDFIDKSVSSIDFSKRLLGQIVFLYFLQKKGWFGVPKDKKWGEGDKNFLRNLFKGEYLKYKNFYNDILEPLFYDALALDRSHLDHWNDHFQCKIPFLNGGLFDNKYNWHETEIELPNDLFSNDYFTKEKDKGTGILDIFDRYNFTVKEDEPLEKEVAVDPEMLGKVFENLLEVKDRKSKGTYYTPREIVHYMCEQSLVNYLATELSPSVIPAKAGIQPPTKEDIEKLIKIGENVVEHEAISISKEDNPEYGGDYKRLLPDTIKDFANEIDDKLATIKVCDPAIGSGAFPVGMMNAIVKARMVLNSYLCHSREGGNPDPDRTLYAFKRDCIQNSLYGVDIDLGAVEIAKLRLWLSLVVDEDNIKQIKPLPNLDYKIMQGNSLLEEFEGIKLFNEKLLETPVINASMFEADNERILKLQSELLQKYYIKNPEWLRNKATDRPDEVRRLEKQLYELMKKKKKVASEDYEQKDLFSDVVSSSQIRDELESFHKRFFNETNGTKKKDLKERIEKLEWELIEATLKEQGKTSALKKLEEFKRSNTKPFFLWKLNFADVFEEKGGFDVVIANPPYIDSEAMVKNGQAEIREAIQKTYKWTKGNWDIYIAFFELGFRELSENGSLTFITPDKWISKPFGNEFRKETINNIYLILKAGRKIFDDAKVDSIVSFFSGRKTNDIKIVNFEDGNFILKREINKSSLLPPYTLDHLFSDSLDLLSKINDTNKKLSEFCKCENACATSDAYKLAPLIRDLGKGSFNSKNDLQIINTGTIGKFYSKWGRREMIYLKHKYLYPVVNKEKFISQFLNSYGAKSLQPKIIIKGLNLLDGCLDEKGSIIPGKTTLMIADNDVRKLKFLLTIINSNLAFFYIKEKYPASSYNQGTSFTKDMINNLSIPKATEKQKDKLIEISEKIPSIAISDDYQNNAEKQAKVHDLEHQIDELVYKLYGLTPEEIKIVEAN